MKYLFLLIVRLLISQLNADRYGGKRKKGSWRAYAMKRVGGIRLMKCFFWGHHTILMEIQITSQARGVFLKPPRILTYSPRVDRSCRVPECDQVAYCDCHPKQHSSSVNMWYELGMHSIEFTAGGWIHRCQSSCSRNIPSVDLYCWYVICDDTY